MGKVRGRAGGGGGEEEKGERRGGRKGGEKASFSPLSVPALLSTSPPLGREGKVGREERGRRWREREKVAVKS